MVFCGSVGGRIEGPRGQGQEHCKRPIESTKLDTWMLIEVEAPNKEQSMPGPRRPIHMLQMGSLIFKCVHYKTWSLLLDFYHLAALPSLSG